MGYEINVKMKMSDSLPKSDTAALIEEELETIGAEDVVVEIANVGSEKWIENNSENPMWWEIGKTLLLVGAILLIASMCGQQK